MRSDMSHMPLVFLVIWLAFIGAVGFAASEPRNGFVMNPARGLMVMLCINLVALAILGDYAIYIFR